MDEETRGGVVALAAVAGTFLALLMAERLRPLRQPRRSPWRRWRVNAWVTAAAFAAGTLAVAPPALAIARWNEGGGIGLLHLAPMPQALRMGLGFLLLDLTFYWWHWANRRVPLLWRFHSAHHIDPDLDATTSFRFHPGEVLYSAPFRMAQVAVLGVDPVTYVAYQIRSPRRRGRRRPAPSSPTLESTPAPR
jgi:sterol desaturase/sphingolipid hydroxylase (fatty acid hydroxylase superfamily)